MKFEHIYRLQVPSYNCSMIVENKAYSEGDEKLKCENMTKEVKYNSKRSEVLDYCLDCVLPLVFDNVAGLGRSVSGAGFASEGVFISKGGASLIKR